MSYVGTTPKFDSVEGENIKLDGNTISSTNTDGDINILPNGNGNVTVPSKPLNDNSTAAATTQYVDQSVSFLDSAIQSQISGIESDITAIESDISALETADASFVKKDGSVAMTGDLSLYDGASHHKVTGLADPTDPRDAVNKQTLDSVTAGIVPRPAVKAATTAPYPAVYNNGPLDDGVGATLNLGTFTPVDPFEVDGITDWALYDGILVKNQAQSLQNGRYFISQVGNNVSTDWILTRCGTCDESDEMPASYMFVQFGNTNQGKGFVAIVGTSAGSDVTKFQIGYDSINFTQFSSAGAYTIGTGLQLIGNELSAKVDNTTVGVSGSGQLKTLVPAPVNVSALNIDWSLGNLFYKTINLSISEPNDPFTFTFSNLEEGKTISFAILNISPFYTVAINFPTVVKGSPFVSTISVNRSAVFTFMRINGKTYATSIGEMA